MTQKLHFAGWLCIAVAVAACNGQHARPTAEEPTDSIAAEDTVPLEQQFLPDTAYASAEALTYEIENADSLPAPLTDLDDPYEKANGIFAFRKNLRRNADFGGRVKGTPSEIEIAWTFKTAYDTTHTRFGVWGGGSGWTGQPLYIKWTDSQVEAFRKAGSKGLTADFSPEEIYVSSLCGKGYFINYQTGKASRKPLDLGNVVKGTGAIDPEYYNLYVGQGVPRQPGPFGHQVFDLLKHERTFFFGPDPKAWRGWNAFDSSPIIAGGYLFWAGENGTVYKYRRSQGQLKRVSAMRYRVGGAVPGIESSICIYKNYGFLSDNHGNVIGINLNTLRPVWHYYNHDDSDGTMVCREENGTPYLYSACEVDKQGSHGQSHFVKLNALNGERVWEHLIECKRLELEEKTLDGGMYASPLLGGGDCANMLFAHVCRNGVDKNVGELTALDTRTGNILYTVPYGQFAWSSPIPFYNERNELFVFTGDASGYVRIIRGKTGEVVCKKLIGYNFESSPIAIGNTAVVGCRGYYIYKFVIK